MPRIVAAVLAAYSFFLIQSSFPHSPARIPIHFNLEGEPNGWGSPQMLWLLLGFQVLVAGVMQSVSFWGRKFPSSIHLGTRSFSDLTPEQRDRALPLLDQMAGWMSVASSLFFVFLIRESIRAAESSNPDLHVGWAGLLFAGGMAGIAVYFVSRINLETQLPQA